MYENRQSSKYFDSIRSTDGCCGQHVISYQVNPSLMTVRLRLAVHGVRNNRIFHLVAIDQRKRRNAKPIELLGIYRQRVEPKSPHKTLEWSVDRIKYWLGVGAQPSDSVVKLLTKVRPAYALAWSCTRSEVGISVGETGKCHTTGFEVASQTYPPSATPTNCTTATFTTMTSSIIDNCYYMLCLIEDCRRCCYFSSFSAFAISS